MRVRYARARRILTRSALGIYTLNHYVGCTHACKYCYAQIYARRYHGIKNWGEEIVVRTNAPQLARREAKPGMHVWLSSMSDPYQPIEADLKLTRRVLLALGAKGARIDVLTKSPLVLRDLDILRRFDAEVGITLVSTKRIEMEARAPPPKARIQALKRLKKAGIRTYVFVGPILPETDVEEIVDKTRDYADFYYFDRLRHARELGLDPYVPDREALLRLVQRDGVPARILF